MTFLEVMPLIGIFIGGLMAFAIGANDVANALGTSVGSGALSIRKAIILGGIFEFAGTMIMGRFVTGTIKAGIVDVNAFSDDMDRFVLGMFCTLAIATSWLLIATWFALPVSTTHTVVGGIVGFALVEKGIAAVHGWPIARILLSWVASPFLGCFCSYVLFFSIQRFVLSRSEPLKESVKFLPLYAGITISILGVFIIQSEAPLAGVNVPIWVSVIVFVILIGLGTAVTKFAILPFLSKSRDWRFMIPSKYRKLEMATVVTHSEQSSEDVTDDVSSDDAKVKLDDIDASDELPTSPGIRDEELDASENNFKALMILSAVFVAFAHGSNDVANAIGPVAAIWEYRETGTVATSNAATVPIWLLLLGGVGIVLGLALLGYKVMATIGEKITKLTHSRGYAAQLSTATTVMVFST
eukprot:TRINITY_DN4239_c0_g1_i2.p1 TRINITY_DN4239_c0_g1~~TRINITY_DN4239_c0_g1_i2.p1  ORF type:complete len:412 (+),score=91.91 TRINITY_DN4239_c0_g1_i2:123-1358(+)